MSYDLVTFNEYCKLILHSYMKYYIIMMTTMLIIVSFNSLRKYFQCNHLTERILHQFGGVPPT